MHGVHMQFLSVDDKYQFWTGFYVLSSQYFFFLFRLFKDWFEGMEFKKKAAEDFGFLIFWC